MNYKRKQVLHEQMKKDNKHLNHHRDIKVDLLSLLEYPYEALL